LPIQYADFALWQRQWLQGDVLEAQLDYWTRQLGGNTPLSLPTDHPRPEILSYQGADYPFTFSSACSEAIVALSRQEEVTLFMLLLAAFQTLLYRYTGQTDIVVGTDMANRTHVETEALIGFFINLLVLRNDLSGAPSFREVLRRTREMVLGAYSHQDTPFEMLVERLLPAQSPNRMPLVQVLFVLQNQPSPYAQLPNLVVSHFAGAETMTAKFELALFMQEWSGGLRGVVKYSSDLFEASSIATMMGRFEVLLRHIVAHPDTPIDVLDFYTDAEKTRQIEQQKKTLHKLKVTKGKEVNLSEM
jgi:non-ribosomal peptide synthetase component F